MRISQELLFSLLFIVGGIVMVWQRRPLAWLLNAFPRLFPVSRDEGERLYRGLWVFGGCVSVAIGLARIAHSFL